MPSLSRGVSARFELIGWAKGRRSMPKYKTQLPAHSGHLNMTRPAPVDDLGSNGPGASETIQRYAWYSEIAAS